LGALSNRLRDERSTTTVLAQTYEDKLAAVREAYLRHIIPGIQRVYEKTNQVREPFILAHCAILSLSGFYAGTKDTNGATYREFTADFFPSGYDPRALWKDLRNSLVHAYTLTSTYILAHRHPEKHLQQERNVKSERTGKPADLTYLNLENFLNDLRQAALCYFQKVETDPELISKLCTRYDIAPPASYISDEDIVEYAGAQV
jgi:hypothetical protein